MTYSTYIVIDPRDDAPVYVGQSSDYQKRKNQHLEVAIGKKPNISGINIRTYLVELYNLGYLPKFKIIEECNSEKESLKSETKCIKKLIQKGIPVLNGWKQHKKLNEYRFGSAYKHYFIKRLSTKTFKGLEALTLKIKINISISICERIKKIPLSKSDENIKDKRIREVRKLYPRAYEPYSDQEDRLLHKAYEEIQNISELAGLFQRQPTAIFSRMKKNGIIKDSKNQNHLGLSEWLNDFIQEELSLGKIRSTEFRSIKIESKNIINYEDRHYISTTSMARIHNVNNKLLLEYFIRIGWTIKAGEKRRLTQIGLGKGGGYKTLNNEEYWIVWPENLFIDLFNNK